MVYAAKMGHLFGNDGNYSDYASTIIAAYPATQAYGKYKWYTNNVETELNYTWGDKSFEWYAETMKSGTDYSDSNSQLNDSGKTYYWIAIG